MIWIHMEFSAVAVVLLVGFMCIIGCMYAVMMTYAPLNMTCITRATTGRLVGDKKIDEGDVDMKTPRKKVKTEPPSTGRTLRYSAERIAKVWRGGCRRPIRMRACRILHNPAAAGDCAFEAMLVRARMRKTPKVRKTLRRIVAQCILHACETGQEVMGISPLPYVHELHVPMRSIARR